MGFLIPEILSYAGGSVGPALRKQKRHKQFFEEFEVGLRVSRLGSRKTAVRGYDRICPLGVLAE